MMMTDKQKLKEAREEIKRLEGELKCARCAAMYTCPAMRGQQCAAPYYPAPYVYPYQPYEPYTITWTATDSETFPMNQPTYKLS